MLSLVQLEEMDDIQLLFSEQNQWICMKSAERRLANSTINRDAKGHHSINHSSHSFFIFILLFLLVLVIREKLCQAKLFELRELEENKLFWLFFLCSFISFVSLIRESLIFHCVSILQHKQQSLVIGNEVYHQLKYEQYNFNCIFSCHDRLGCLSRIEIEP